MKVTLAAVISLDGKITKHNDPDLHSWVSDEDQQHFAELISGSDSIILGRKTYEMMRGNIEHRDGLLRLVLTTRPEKYVTDVVEGQLEFIKADPKATIDYLEQLGKQNILLAGGEKILTDFLADGLVDELYVTIEPKIFGAGTKLVSDQNLDVELELIEVIKLNTSGTALFHYQLIR